MIADRSISSNMFFNNRRVKNFHPNNAPRTINNINNNLLNRININKQNNFPNFGGASKNLLSQELEQIPILINLYQKENNQELPQTRGFKIRSFQKHIKKQSSIPLQMQHKNIFDKLMTTSYQLKTIESSTKNQQHMLIWQNLKSIYWFPLVTPLIILYSNNNTQCKKKVTLILSINILKMLSQKFWRIKNYQSQGKLFLLNNKNKMEISSNLYQLLKAINNQCLIKSNISLIFRANSIQQGIQLQNILKDIGLKYECIYILNNKYSQSISVYDIGQIVKIGQKLLMLQDQSTLKMLIPITSHIIDGCFFTIRNLSPALAFNALIQLIQFTNQLQESCYKDKIKWNGKTNIKCSTVIIHKDQLKHRVKQNYQYKQFRRQLRSHRTRSTGSLSNQYLNNNQNNLLNIKQKIIKFIKIKQNDKQMSKNRKNSEKNQLNEIVFGMSQCQAKTVYQITSELIRLNSRINTQITKFINNCAGIDLQQLNIENLDQENNNNQTNILNIYYLGK